MRKRDEGSIPFTRSNLILTNRINVFVSFWKVLESNLLRKLTTIARRFNMVKTVRAEGEFNQKQAVPLSFFPRHNKIKFYIPASRPRLFRVGRFQFRAVQTVKSRSKTRQRSTWRNAKPYLRVPATFLQVYGTERMRQKLFVVEFGVLVNTKFPFASAGFVTCGIQLAGDRLKERSSAYFHPATPTYESCILPKLIIRPEILL